MTETSTGIELRARKTRRALDLFCGAGGASMGLYRAGFEVVGVDIEAQPHYPFTLLRADALKFIQLGPAGLELLCQEIPVELTDFDLIWASPPCQAFTAYKRRPGHVRPRDNLIPELRSRLIERGVTYIIENVRGAPLQNPVMLCGSMFGLDVQRHRYFETSFTVKQPECRHHRWTPRFPPATNRTNLRRTVEVGVYRIPLSVQREAMGIDWMNLSELSQAIPPHYANFLAHYVYAGVPATSQASTDDSAPNEIK